MQSMARLIIQPLHVFSRILKHFDLMGMHFGLDIVIFLVLHSFVKPNRIARILLGPTSVNDCVNRSSIDKVITV